MKFLTPCLYSALLLFISQSTLADELPAPIRNGLQSYSQEGAEQAVKMWLKKSPLERTGEVPNLVKMLNNIEHLCGEYIDYQVVKVHHFTASSRFVYLQLNYASCPIFGRFVAYEGKAGWLITQLNFNAKPEQVLPESLLN
jgi:hypothetical protein